MSSEIENTGRIIKKPDLDKPSERSITKHNTGKVNIEKSGRSVTRPDLGKSKKKTLGRVKPPRINKTQEKIRIAFLFDATSSRDRTWEDAQVWQEEIINEYASAGAEVGIVVFRGGKVKKIGWFTNGHDAKSAMKEIKCEAGLTQIAHGLRVCNGLSGEKPPKAIIMIGDAYEEEDEHYTKVATELKKKNIPVHAFFEEEIGTDMGKDVYKTIANITGGAFINLGPDMNLKKLIEKLFEYNLKGETVSRKRLAEGNPEVKLLVEGGLLRLNSSTENK